MSLSASSTTQDLPGGAHTESSDLPRFTELGPWFDEFSRLAAEARHRFDQGDVISALASLAAVPMVHEILVDRCGSISSNQPDANHRPGLYL